MLGLKAYFITELVRANLHMAVLALGARPRLNGLIVLASLTGLLPGTAALGFSYGFRPIPLLPGQRRK